MAKKLYLEEKVRTLLGKIISKINNSKAGFKKPVIRF
jgi:hypothetical protein